MSLTADIVALYDSRGTQAYFGERVSMTEHGLQAAHFAELEGAPEALVLAALLHDIGHLIEPQPDALEDWTLDAHHEVSGARWLARHFDAAISEPVRLHVPAKRYLCATDADYMTQLSTASVHTLKLQGGAMPPGAARLRAAHRAPGVTRRITYYGPRSAADCLHPLDRCAAGS